MVSRHRTYQALTLDMGFTLVNLKARFEPVLVDLAARAGLSVGLEDVRAANRAVWQKQGSLDATRTWQPSLETDRSMAYELDRNLCLQLGITDPALHAEAHRRAREIFHDVATFQVYPEVPAVLAALRQIGLTLGIVSNWGWQLPRLCEQLSLAGYFDFILTSARVGASKPHPAIFRAALQRAGCPPERTMHVGDSLFADVLGAQAIGMTGVLLDRPGLAEANDYPVLRTLDGLLPLLEGKIVRG